MDRLSRIVFSFTFAISTFFRIKLPLMLDKSNSLLFDIGVIFFISKQERNLLKTFLGKRVGVKGYIIYIALKIYIALIMLGLLIK